MTKPIYTSKLEQTANENIQSQKKDAGFGELYSRAFELDSTITATANIIAETGFESDPEYTLTEENLTPLTEGIPRQYWDSFSSAVSQEHAEYISSNIKRELDEEEFLAEHGWAGFGARAAVAVTDPTTVALAAAPWAALTMKGSRLARAAKFGLIAAGENAAVEAYLTTGSNTRDSSDILYAGLTGFALGGALGALLPKGGSELGDAAENFSVKTELREAKDAGVQLSESGEQLVVKHPNEPVYTPLKPETIEASRGRIVLLDKPSAKTSDEMSQDIDIFEGDSAGAAAADGGADRSLWDNPLDEQRVMELADEAPEAAFGALRFDLTGRLLSSDNAFVRGLGGLLAEDGVGHKNLDQVQKRTVSETADLNFRTDQSDFYRGYNTAYDKWLDDNKYKATDRFFLKARKDFNEQVGRYIRGIEGEYHPSVIEVATKSQRLFKKRLKLMQDSKVKNAKNVEANEGYLPRVISHEKFKGFLDTYGEAGLIKLVRGSIAKSLDFLDEAKLDRIAKGYVKTLRRAQSGVNDIAIMHGVDIDDSEDLISAILRDTEVDEGDIAAIIEDIKSHKVRKSEEQGAGSIKNLKARLDLDETHEAQILNKETGQVENVRLNSIWEDDIETLFERYNRTTAGWSALSDIAGIDSPNMVSKVKAAVYEEGDNAGMTRSEIGEDWKRVSAIIDHTVGKSLERSPDSTVSNFGRVLRTYNYSRIGGQFGFAQVAELGNIIGLGGLRGFLQVMPEWATVFNRAQNGDLDNAFFRELEGSIAMGTDFLRNPVATRPDDFGISGTQQGFEVAMNQSGRLVSAMSAMAPINALLQRTAAGTMAHRISKMAFSKKLSKIDMRRLKSFGIDEAMWSRMQDSIKTHSETVNGVLGRKFKSINMDAWDDIEAAEALRFALHRSTRRIIQENDIGTQMLWTVDSPYGKMIAQFRNFAFTAVYKQTLRGAHNIQDLGNATAFTASMGIAGAVYVGQTYLNYPTDEKKRKELLSPKRIAAAAFARSGYASMIPAGIDAMSYVGGYDPMFSHTRTSGLSSGDFLSNPTTDIIDKGLLTLPKAAIGLAKGEGVSENDAKRLASALPFYRVLGIKHGLDYLAEEIADSTQ